MSKVTLRVADARLLAPVPVRRVTLFGELEDWRSALTDLGVAIVDDGADLVVADSAHAEAAARVGAPAVVVLAARRRELQRAGYRTRTVLVRPGPAGPRLFVPVDAPNATRHALLTSMPGRSRLKRLAVGGVVWGLRAGVPLRGAITLATRDDPTPLILRRALGAAVTSDWYLATGAGDDLQRLVWFCFGDGRREPTVVVKCSRVPGHDAPFIRDERALRSLDVLPPDLRKHAPRLEERLEVDGLPVAVETAAPGQPLHVRLEDGPDAHADVVARIADWIVDVEAATILPPAELDGERSRLAALSRESVTLLPALPAVLQHNDLGCWNVVVGDETFTVVDWESSRRAGLPLWDLVYFLADALTAGPGAGKHERVAALLRGELASSATLFDRVRAAAERLDVPPAAVGPIVTLAWLHHGTSAAKRADLGAERGAHAGAPSAAGPLQQVATYWLTDPALGVAWAAYTGAPSRVRSRAPGR
jgi:hypothetical protein